jgi:hypothetical protein
MSVMGLATLKAQFCYFTLSMAVEECMRIHACCFPAPAQAIPSIPRYQLHINTPLGRK